MAKAQLNQAIGDSSDTNYDVQDEKLPPVPGEEDSLDSLVADALRDRPDLLAFERQRRAGQLSIASAKGAYGPALGAAMTMTEAGTDLTNLTWNWNASLNLTWNLFQGLLTQSQVKEAKANLSAVEAQRAGQVNQVRVDVESAQLQVRDAQVAASTAAAQSVSAEYSLATARAALLKALGRL